MRACRVLRLAKVAIDRVAGGEERKGTKRTGDHLISKAVRPEKPGEGIHQDRNGEIRKACGPVRISL